MIKINILNSYDKIELTFELTNNLESKSSIKTVTTRLLSLHEAQKFRLELLKKRVLNKSSNIILLFVNEHKFFLTTSQITFMIYRLKEQIDQLKVTQTQISELNAIVI